MGMNDGIVDSLTIFKQAKYKMFALLYIQTSYMSDHYEPNHLHI